MKTISVISFIRASDKDTHGIESAVMVWDNPQELNELIWQMKQKIIADNYIPISGERVDIPFELIEEIYLSGKETIPVDRNSTIWKKAANE